MDICGHGGGGILATVDVHTTSTFYSDENNNRVTYAHLYDSTEPIIADYFIGTCALFDAPVTGGV